MLSGLFLMLYSMKIKEQTRKLAAGCSKHNFEIADKTDEVSSKHGFEVVDETDEVSYLYLRQGEADVVWRDFRRVLELLNVIKNGKKEKIFMIF